MKLTEYELDSIFDYIDYLLRKGKFKTVDAILDAEYDSDLDNIDEKLAYLTITAAASSKLKNRAKFYVNFENHLIDTENPEKDKLLIGLK
ncbi:MAG: hypothetical protein AABY22_05555 [Nanoarchaeota archaeon]